MNVFGPKIFQITCRALKDDSGELGFNFTIQAFLDFRGFHFRDFRFTTVYNSILFSSPLVLLSNLDLRSFASTDFCVSTLDNSVNQGMPVMCHSFLKHFNLET